MLIAISLLMLTIVSIFIIKFATQGAFNSKLNLYVATSNYLDKNGSSVFK